MRWHVEKKLTYLAQASLEMQQQIPSTFQCKFHTQKLFERGRGQAALPQGVPEAQSSTRPRKCWTWIQSTRSNRAISILLFRIVSVVTGECHSVKLDVMSCPLPLYYGTLMPAEYRACCCPLAHFEGVLSNTEVHHTPYISICLASTITTNFHCCQGSHNDSRCSHRHRYYRARCC